jgi:two-component system OmpR family sensor kinase
LIAGIVGLIVVLSAVIGVTTEIFLSKYLVGQLDQQLSGTTDRIRPPEPAGPGTTTGEQPPGVGGTTAPPSGSGSLNRAGNRTGTLFATVSDGTVATCAVLVDSTTSTDSTTATTSRYRAVPKVLAPSACSSLGSLSPGSQPVTVTINGEGTYRVKAVADAQSAGTVLVAGLPMEDVENVQQRLAVIMALVAGGAIILGGLVVFFIVSRSVRPLERVAATARKVATLPLDKGEVDLAIRVPAKDTDPRTEIGSVGAAINQMLGHVSGALTARHASETRVRQFVADASHELRTPLAAIRGYAELARRGEHEPGAVAHALRRVESESERMTTLVDDLLLLARLDSGRPLDSAEVDLTMLAVDRVSDARVAGPDHRWQLDLPDEPVSVIGDGARLHQVLANLLANARNHTPPGTTVVTGVRREMGGALLTVTDNGPGIPEELQPEIFGRFVRGDSSRSRAAGSTGLGLAIVAAVISAHGGTVTVESRPGRTSARVWLPDHIEFPSAPVDPLPATSASPSLSGA